MTIDALTQEEKSKLKTTIDTGLKVLQEIDDLKGGLSDTVKAVAEELNIKAPLINKALRAAFKANIDEEKDAVSDVEEILVLVGRR